jgi:polysaccharide export outer membrane protein
MKSICIGLFVGVLAIFTLFSGPQLQAQVSETYRVGAGDVLSVFVWQHPDLSSEVSVMPDGSITYPLCGTFEIGGLTTDEVTETLREKLSEYIMNPQITITMKRYTSEKVSIIGAVQKPGSYPWTQNLLLSDYIGLAGGPSAHADISTIYISRKHEDNTVVIEVELDEILSKGERRQDIPLQPGDLVTIPQEFSWIDFRWAIASLAALVSLGVLGYRLWK